MEEGPGAVGKGVEAGPNRFSIGCEVEKSAGGCKSMSYR